MKVIVQIPCLNEEAALPVTLAALPRSLPGAQRVEWLVIDDGSNDRTCEVARELGVDHIVRHTQNWGLARAFMTGLDACVRLGADVIVNTDADNQYVAADIPKLVAPVIAGEADMVIGDRGVSNVEHFSWTKRRFQSLGSWVVNRASGTAVPDTTSGFRALSRAAALKVNVLSDFTYTLETIIQAGHKNLVVSHVPVRTNPALRPSRLFGSTFAYIRRSVTTILRIYSMYRPLQVFSFIAALLFLPGVALGARFMYLYASGQGDGHVQSLLLGVLLVMLGGQTAVAGLLADLIARNRQLSEEVLWRVRKLEVDKPVHPELRVEEGVPVTSSLAG